MYTGEPYFPNDDEILNEQQQCLEKLYDFNATPPHEFKKREKAYQFNNPVKIGKNCWLGAGVIAVPGVTIGNNTVIGAGSVVTKDIPSGVVAVGNPCRFLRKIDERDYEYYFKNKKPKGVVER